MSTTYSDPDIFLREVYLHLDYESDLGSYDLSNTTSYSELRLGSWLEQVAKLGAQRIFYVHGHPTVIFFRLTHLLGVDTSEIEDKIREIHIEVWNTSRIPLFFVALPTELRIYSAFQKPARTVSEWTEKSRWLKRIEDIAQISETLRDFSRLEVESGRLFFEKENDFKRENRVDRWLLRNLRLLRRQLQGEDLEKREHVHALIGRSIFIRYLEDRDVLVPEYFLGQTDGKHKSYAECLRSKADTFSLFKKLRVDFNGDIFPLSEAEEEKISERDVSLMRDFLLGRDMGAQPDLLFWAYRFDVIPVEVVSSIYEEFYDENSNDEDTGTHYTPTSLVDFVLAQTLTQEKLDSGVRVLDPACGSGVFLVEVFRKLVQHRKTRAPDKPLLRKELTEILLNSVVGIDVNSAAIQVAAFSLYLALLDYLNPPDIRKHKHLPKLVYNPGVNDSGHNLFQANAFWLTHSEQTELEKRVATGVLSDKESNDIAFLFRQPKLQLKNHSFDVIIGNPPWGADDTAKRPLSLRWCGVFSFPIGDKELSQSFICRAQYLLKEGGEIGLLVSTGVLFKHEETSVAFRKRWLRENRIRAVFNFAHVRDVFFKKQKKDAIAPFIAVFYTPSVNVKGGPLNEISLRNRIAYYSIKKTRFIERLQTVVIDADALQFLRQETLLSNDWLWKTYMWGGSSDAELIGELKSLYPSLSSIITAHGRGYQEGGGKKEKHTREFGVSVELATDLLAEIPNDLLRQETYQSGAAKNSVRHYFTEVLSRYVHALGQPIIFYGPRILIKRGVSRSKLKNGEIQARLTNVPFAVRNSVIGVRVDDLSEEQSKVVLGIIRSSLAKYYHFLTCSTWGFWHYEIHVEEHLGLPICMPDDASLQRHIVDTVDQMLEKTNEIALLRQPIDENVLQQQLDNLIFKLYSLSEEQQDLVTDLCYTTLEFFYNGSKSRASSTPDAEWLVQYCQAFSEIWNERLNAKSLALQASIYLTTNGLMCGMAFELKEKTLVTSPEIVQDDLEWRRWFRKLSQSLMQRYSSQVYTDMVVKELSDSAVFIAKRGERRLWTKSKAREDARELLTEVFKLEWQRTKGVNNDVG